MEKRKPSYTVGRNASWCSHCERSCGGSFRKQKTDGRIVPDLEQRKLYAKSHTEKNSKEKIVHFPQNPVEEKD